MYSKKIRLPFLYLFISASIFCQNSQEFTQISKNKFSDGTKVASLHKFEHVFSQTKDDHKRFKRFNRTRKTQRIVNYSFLGMMVAAGIVDYTCDGDICGEAGITIGGSLVSGILMLITNSILGPIKKSRKRKLLKESPNFHKRSKLENIKLRMKSEQRSQEIGLVLSF